MSSVKRPVETKWQVYPEGYFVKWNKDSKWQKISEKKAKELYLEGVWFRHPRNVWPDFAIEGNKRHLEKWNENIKELIISALDEDFVSCDEDSITCRYLTKDVLTSLINIPELRFFVVGHIISGYVSINFKHRYFQ